MSGTGVEITISKGLLHSLGTSVSSQNVTKTFLSWTIRNTKLEAQLHLVYWDLEGRLELGS